MTMHKVNPPSPAAPKAEIAQWLASRGFSVFRLNPNSKTPYADGWQAEATDDPLEARLLFSGRHGQCNIGIRGVGHLIVDLDVKDGHRGPDEWRELLDEYGDIAANGTVSQLTPTGGYHLFYRLPDGAEEAKNTKGSLAEGIDTRGAGGYVVGHGSTIDGKPYVMTGDVVMQAPAWLLALNGSQRRKRQDADQLDGEVDREVDIEAAIEMIEAHHTVVQGGRNNALFVLAKRLRDRSLSRRTVTGLLFERFIETKLVPPMEHEEAYTCINSAYSNNDTAGGGAQAANVFGAAVLEPDDEPKPSKFPFLPIGDVVYSGAPRYVVKHLISAGNVGMITGTSEAGKSPIMLDMAMRVALGLEWNGKRTKTGYVLHFSTEGGVGLRGRYEAQKRILESQGTSRAEIDSAPFDMAETRMFSYPVTLVSGEDGSRDDAVFVTRLINFVHQRAEHYGVDPALVVFDTFSPMLGGKSDSEDAACREALANMRRITAKLGCAVMFVHHPTKAKADAGGATFRGSSVLLNDTDLQLWAEMRNGIGELTTPRIKDYAAIKPIGYTLRIVTLLENDGEGDKSTSIGVEYNVKAGRLDPTAAEVHNGEEVARAGGDQYSRRSREILTGMCRVAHSDTSVEPTDRWFVTAVLKTYTPGRKVISDFVQELEAAKLIASKGGDNNAKSYRLTTKGINFCKALDPDLVKRGFIPAKTEEDE